MCTFHSPTALTNCNIVSYYPNYTADTKSNVHACVCTCINATSSSTATAPLWGVFSTQFYTMHSAWFPCRSRILLLYEALQSKRRLKSAFFHFCGCSRLCPQRKRPWWGSCPFQWATPGKALSTMKGIVEGHEDTGSIRSRAEDCVSWLYWPGTCFSSNPVNLWNPVKSIDTILPILQWQVAFLEA